MDEPDILSLDDLGTYGLSFRHRRRDVERGILLPIRSGRFALAEQWRAATPEERIVARARALTAASRTAPVFSHETAAAIHGLPLFAPHGTHLHVTLPAERPGSAAFVIRHRGETEESIDIRGLRCTPLDVTLADMARTATLEQTVTVTDAALRRRFSTDLDDYRRDEADAFVEELLALTRQRPHGQTRAARALRFADGRAQLPGESVSRIRLSELGFRRPRLQVAVAQPNRARSFYLDFGMDDVEAWGEFDGRVKYRDGRLLVDRTADEVFEAEKAREDWIRGVTRRPVLRWGWPHIGTASALGARLAAFGVRAAA